MSRLEFGPEPEEMEVTDIRTGHFVFRPVPGKKVSYRALEEAIENAGYEIEAASVAVTGTVTEERHLRTPGGQEFHLTAPDGETGEGRSPLAALEPGAKVTVEGAWTAHKGAEVVAAEAIRPAGEAGPGPDQAPDQAPERP